jgi:hypothetical protein
MSRRHLGYTAAPGFIAKNRKRFFQDRANIAAGKRRDFCRLRTYGPFLHESTRFAAGHERGGYVKSDGFAPQWR